MENQGNKATGSQGSAADAGAGTQGSAGTGADSQGGIERFLMHDRPLTARDWGIDALVMAAAFAFGCLQVMLAAWNVVMPDDMLRRFLGVEDVVVSPAVFLALALTTVPLAVRRRFPWPVLVFVMIVYLGLQGVFRGLSLPLFGPMIALCTVAVECSRAETVAATALCVLGLVVVSPSQSASLALLMRLQNIALMAAAALAGYAYRTRREAMEAIEQRAAEAERTRESEAARRAEAERTRESEAARRVEAERVRIAREVHDITAHSLSAVSVQAAAAERMIDADPQAAREAIASVRRTSKEALDEIRHLVGVLRQDGSAAELAPAEGTERLPDVVGYLERAGVAVSLDTSGYCRASVPALVDVALFGIAREAATNIVRHAGASRAWLTLASGNGRASLSVEDDGRGCAVGSGTGAGDAPEGMPGAVPDGPAAVGGLGAAGAGTMVGVTGRFGGAPAAGAPAAGAPAAGAPAVGAPAEAPGALGASGTPSAAPVGHGMEGMRERVRALGGTFEAGNRPGGGFRLAAYVPVPTEGKGRIPWTV